MKTILTSKKRKKKGLRIFFLVIFVLVAGESACQLWNAYEGWKKYGRFLLGRTTVQRDQLYSIGKPWGVKRIVLLGGSAAYDTSDSYRESWPHKLEQFLNDSYPNTRKVEVINFGFYSETSTHEWEKLATLGWKLSPDLVMVFDGFNDVYNLWHAHESWKREYEITKESLLYGKRRARWKQAFYGFRRSLKENSALYERLNQGIKFIRRRLSLRALNLKREARKDISGIQNQGGLIPEPGPKAAEEIQQKASPGRSFFEAPARWPEIRKDYLEIYGSNLERIAKVITEKTKARGLFIFQPDLSYKPLISASVSERERREYLSIIGNHEKSWKEILKLAYPAGIQLMERAASKYGFEFYDFNQRILTRGEAAALFTGNVHFAGEGKETIANEIGKIILDQKLLDPKKDF